jgi:hypothetical protein
VIRVQPPTPGAVVTGKMALVNLALIVTEAGTVATAGVLFESWTVVGNLVISSSVTLPVELLPAATSSGVTVTDEITNSAANGTNADSAKAMPRYLDNGRDPVSRERNIRNIASSLSLVSRRTPD